MPVSARMAVTCASDERHEVLIVPLRHGTKAVGLLAATSSTLDIGALDAVAGVVAIAIERAQFLGEREAAELVRQKADLAATLLASLSHDLRTPLTAIRVAVENLRGELPADERRAQAGAAMAELDRLKRLFQDILDMARIDAAAIRVERQWVTPADVVDAALAHVRHALDGHPLQVEADAEMEVEIDPRLASVALSHVLENAAHYSPADQPIVVQARVAEDGLRISVTDHGPGLDPGELEHLFERFYRGRTARQVDVRHRDGARDYARAVVGRRRPGLGRECPGGRRDVLDRRSRSRPRRDGRLVVMAARILIVDDEPNILGTMAPLLRARGTRCCPR